MTGPGSDAWHSCLYVWALWSLIDRLACMWGREPCRLDGSCLKGILWEGPGTWCTKYLMAAAAVGPHFARACNDVA